MHAFLILLALASIFSSLSVSALPSSHRHYNSVTFEDCATECDKSSCPPTPECGTDIHLDKCGCCAVCARIENELCDPPYYSGRKEHYRFGQCGKMLDCKQRFDLKQNKDKEEWSCVCRQSGFVCGSDDRTYDSICQLTEKAKRHKETLRLKSKGPCIAVPWIVTEPDDVIAKRGEHLSLMCEAMGYPIPSIEWQMTKTDGTTVDLPSDNQHVAVQARGGPEQYELTGWLQMMDVEPDNEGDYYCVVKNSEGETRAKAVVTITDDD